MKYLVIDDCSKFGMDEFVEEFETVEEAVDYADREFDRMTKYDKSCKKQGKRKGI